MIWNWKSILILWPIVNWIILFVSIVNGNNAHEIITRIKVHEQCENFNNRNYDDFYWVLRLIVRMSDCLWIRFIVFELECCYYDIFIWNCLVVLVVCDQPCSYQLVYMRNFKQVELLSEKYVVRWFRDCFIDAN